MDNKEFVEFIKKYGDIRPVQEAFKEYPVEEEEYKGSYYEILKEKLDFN